MRLLGTAASGIRAQQVALDTVGNNIANVNTSGYKANRVDFAHALAAELRPEEVSYKGEPVGERVNVGAGVLYNSVSTDFRQGNLIDTGNPFDLGIEGEGFFPVQRANGETGYTRVGDFKPDVLGQLINAEGQKLEVRIPLEVANLRVEETGKLIGTLKGEQKVFGQVVSNTPEGEPNTYPLGPLQRDELGRPLDGNGELLSIGIVIPNGAEEVSISPEGVIRGKVNGNLQELGQIAIVSFSNQEGLEKIGENLFIVPNAPGVVGDELVGAPGNQVQGKLLGKLRAQSLEQSNVDLGAAMTDLIQVQRAYQMNARLIQNGDQMWSLANSLRR